MPTDVRRDLVVIVASAGGLTALRALVAHLPADLDAVVLAALHTAPTYRTTLVDLLQRVSGLPVEPAAAGQRLTPGRIVVSPSHHVMRVTPDRIVQFAPLPPHDGRTSLDALLRSAAEACGPSVIGVVLSGTLDCGAAGLMTVKDQGGLTMAQDPREAAYPSMPSTAIERVGVDIVAPAADLGALIGRAVKSSTAP